MKFLLLFLLVLCPVFAQPNSGSGLVAFDSGIADNKYGRSNDGVNNLISNFKFTWQITRAANGDKTFNFIVYKCIYTLQIQLPFGLGFEDIPLPFPVCTQLSKSTAEDIGTVQAGLLEFDSLAPGQVAHTVVYGPFAETTVVYRPFAETAEPRFTIGQPGATLDPEMIMLDGLGNSIFKFDLTTFTIVSQVVVPSTTGPYGVRPTATGPQNEVWVANGGLEVSVVDLGAQQLLANIVTPSIPQAATPAGIVFINSGATALEAVKYSSPDSSANQGALLVFDAANRKVTSTLALKDRPTALLMAPDGLTAYLLDDVGTITYYDVFSGTADLTASTYTPGMSGGYPGSSSQVFIHPDGTRLFWNVGVQLDVFDLTTRKITNQFDTGLPTTSAASMQMSQDGSTVWFANALGNVVILDTRYGNILATYQTSPGSQVFPGPAY